MGQAKGFLAVAGYKKGAAWGTPVLVAANNGIEIHSDGIASDSQLIPFDSVSGSVQQRAGDKGNEFHKGDWVVPAKFETLTTLLALAMGTAGAPVQQGLDLAYKHTLKIKKDLAGLFTTLVLDYQEEVHEYPSVKVGGFKLDIQMGKEAVLTFKLICDSLNRNTGAGTNKTSTIAGITMTTNRQRLLFPQLVFRMNDQGGAALAGGDKQYLTGLVLEVDRNFKEDDVTTQRGYLIDEPIQNGFAEIKGVLTFSKFATDNVPRFTEMLAKTQKKADIVLTDGIANGATNYVFTAYLNAIQFESGRPNISGPALTPWSLPFVCHEVAASPTGFPAGYTDALTLEIINSLAADSLA